MLKTRNIISCLFLAVVFLGSSFKGQAQELHPYKGSLVYTLGPDTTDIGNFELNGDQFKLAVVAMSPSVVVDKMEGTVFPGGQLKSLSGYSYIRVKAKDSIIYRYQLKYERDSTFIETQRAGKTNRHAYPDKIMVANSLGGDAIVFIPVMLSHFAPQKVGDSLLSHHIVFNSARKFILKRTGEHQLTWGSSVMGVFKATLDAKGNTISVDGIGTSFNIIGKAGPYLNIDSVISLNTRSQHVRPQLSVINQLDSVKASIGSTHIRVVYSRPSIRNRTIFGAVVPWNRVWRTGADAATRIQISKPLYFQGKELAAGEYSIFTLPAPDRWTIIFNKKANIWGTEYDSAYDVLKVPMQITLMPGSTEMLTIELLPTKNNSGELTITWEKTKASLDFTTAE